MEMATVSSSKEEQDAFLHTAEAAGPRRLQDNFRIEAATLVFDLKVQLFRVSPNAHSYTGHTGVSRSIG
jgi:hypothetical protein